MKVLTHTVLSFLAVLLFTVASLLDILWAKTLYPTPEIYASLFPVDVINLVIGLAALILGSTKKLRTGRLALPIQAALLLFILYYEILVVYAIHSATSIILLLVTVPAVLTLIEVPAYQKLLESKCYLTRPTVHAAILIAMSLFLLIKAGLQLIGPRVSSLQTGNNIAGLLFCSLWLANGIGFLRNPNRCFLAAFICYIHGSLLFASLLLDLILKSLMLGIAFNGLEFAIIAAMSLAFFIPTFYQSKQITTN